MLISGKLLETIGGSGCLERGAEEERHRAEVGAVSKVGEAVFLAGCSWWIEKALAQLRPLRAMASPSQGPTPSHSALRTLKAASGKKGP